MPLRLNVSPATGGMKPGFQCVRTHSKPDLSAGGTDNFNGGSVTYYQGIRGAADAMNVNIVLTR
jgi:hypothetical protein